MRPTHAVTGDLLLVTHTVTPENHGVRLDQFLKDFYTRRSRERLQEDIRSGVIRIVRNQSPHLTVGRLKPSFQLITGDEVHVTTRKKPEPPVSFDYKVLYEDEALFVIDKPPNLPVHPAGRYYFNTLLVHLRSQGFTAPLQANREFFLVHRIDKETSGILVLSKSSETCAHLVKQFAERKTEKTYLALVRDRVEKDEFSVDLAMARDPKSRIKLKMATMPESEGGQASLTHFKVLERARNLTLVECYPKTGRQHQIRVHLDAVGHPIIGDKLYGLPESEALKMYERPESNEAETKAYLPPELEIRLGHPRHALHASGIRFLHPLTNQPMDFRSELAPDLKTLLESQKQILRPDSGFIQTRLQSELLSKQL
jgi:23S rRNA pseudouridine1911/1915/1917 synthase